MNEPFIVKPTVNLMITPKKLKNSFFNKKLQDIKKKKTTVKNPKKKLKCSPYARAHSINRGKTCMTKAAIHKIMNEYNAKYPDNKITATHETDIYAELESRLADQCKDESCWLDVIQNGDDKSKFKNELFAPTLEHAGQLALSTTNVREVLKGYEKINPSFMGTVTPINYSYIHNGKCINESLCRLNLANLMKKGITKIGIVFNIADSFNSGGHWIAMFIDAKPDIPSEAPYIYLFDSYGMGYMIKKEYKDSNKWLNTFISEVKRQGEKMGIKFELMINKTRHQVNDGICGVYALFVIITLLTRKWYGEEDGGHLALKDLKKLFKDNHISEKFIEEMRITYFNE